MTVMRRARDAGFEPWYINLSPPCWIDKSSGTIGYDLHTDGPNLGRDGGPTFVHVGRLATIHFSLVRPSDAAAQ
jgi:hypothetical protein